MIDRRFQKSYLTQNFSRNLVDSASGAKLQDFHPKVDKDLHDLPSQQYQSHHFRRPIGYLPHEEHP